MEREAPAGMRVAFNPSSSVRAPPGPPKVLGHTLWFGKNSTPNRTGFVPRLRMTTCRVFANGSAAIVAPVLMGMTGAPAAPVVAVAKSKGTGVKAGIG
jgi:hypothetical protein